MDKTNISTHKEQLSKWTPSLLLKIGVIINIVFCSIMSILLPLVIITIPAIALNGLLLVPRIDTKRYYAWWRVIPIILVLILTLIITLSIFFIVTVSIDAYNSFADFIDTYIIFWRRSAVMPSATAGSWFDILLAVIAGIGFTGCTFISLGWYKKKRLAIVDVEDK